MQVRSVIVDFDGTACSHDVAEHLLVKFGDPSWPEYDDAWERGEIGTHDAILAQAALLDAPLEDMVAFAVDHCPMDPTFAGFVGWLRGNDVDVAIASDGFGFYIPPLLASVGVGDLRVVTNTWSGGNPPIHFENGHPECAGCGTCKMREVLDARARGPVAFVGEGASDRFGALYADVAYAKDALVEICERDGVPFEPWRSFDDVRASLESMADPPDAVAPSRCPGWRAR